MLDKLVELAIYKVKLFYYDIFLDPSHYCAEI